jgi:tRNA pseudouridine13 synthase
MKHWPRRCGLERRVLSKLMTTHKPSAAIRMIDEPLRRLWVSALQSKVFNEVLTRRLSTYDRIIDGDFAWKHENGACFPVENLAAEQPRAEAFEISPTGPLIGYRMSSPAGEALRVEQEVLAEHGLAPEQFREPGKHKVKGARRPLRVKLEAPEVSAGADDFGPYISIAFTLPAGAFATVVLREIMKSDAKEGS